MVDESADGERMTSADFLSYHKKLRARPESSWVGAWLNRLEFSILLRFLGEVDSVGRRYLTIENLRNLYEHAVLPPIKRPLPSNHKWATIRGRLMRQESGRDNYLPGLRIELWQKRLPGDTLIGGSLLAIASTSEPNGEFELRAVLPAKGLPLMLRVVDPRPTMTRDRKFFKIMCPGRVSGDLNLGILRVPHWQYDRSFPFPVARKNDFTSKVPQRFTLRMTFAFLAAGFWLQKVKMRLVSLFRQVLSLEALQLLFPADGVMRRLQDQDLDGYFMYRVLNGFYPAPVYLVPAEDQSFNGAKYFIDCDFDEYESDGSHNLISGRLYFNVEESDREPKPCGISLRIRAADRTQRQPGDDEDTCRVACGETTEWVMAKRAFRSAWATAGELDAHLGSGHLNVGQYALAAYRNLYHSPIADLLLPVLSGVTDINEQGKDAIFGVSGVLSTNSPLTTGALWVRLINHLGTLDWYGWKPPEPLYDGHIYAKAANIFWDVADELVESFFDKNDVEIVKHWVEIERFSKDIYENCVPYFQPTDSQPAGQTEGRNLEKIGRPRGLSARQEHYQLFKSLNHFTPDSENKETSDSTPAVSEISTPEDLKQCCKYIIFHATFWHWWSNDLQATDLTNIFYTSLGLRNGALGTEEEILPPVLEAAGQLSFAKLLTTVDVGKIMDQEQEGVMSLFAQLLEKKRIAFKELENPNEPVRTFNIDNIRSRTNI